MISVCMATYNGAEYLKQQMDSILCQLDKDDELVISDDGSSDDTLKIIRTYSDDRIKLLINNSRHGVTYNFENALKASKGELIFLADQDDVWDKEKIKEIKDFFMDGDYDVVSCNCRVTNSDLRVIEDEYFCETNPVSQSILKNLIINKWLGCCMAFKREILDEILPIPDDVIAHDIWIGIYSQIRFKCGYYPHVLQSYRRHDATVSSAAKKSTNPLLFRLKYRWNLAKALWKKLHTRL